MADSARLDHQRKKAEKRFERLVDREGAAILHSGTSALIIAKILQKRASYWLAIAESARKL